MNPESGDMRQPGRPLFQVLAYPRSQTPTTRRKSADKWRRWVSALAVTNVPSSTPTSGLEKGPEVLPEERARARAKARAKGEPPHLVNLMRQPRDRNPEHAHLPNQDRRFALTGKREAANVEKTVDGLTLQNVDIIPVVIEGKPANSRTMRSPRQEPPL